MGNELATVPVSKRITTTVSTILGTNDHSCVSRLWDTYFATNDLDLHSYVCLAILQANNETLMELEYSEICLFLNNLPDTNMEQIIKQAHNIRAMVKARDLL
jgi:hypothetical protein